MVKGFETLTNPKKIPCTSGGFSLPFLIEKPDYLPFSTILFKLVKSDKYVDETSNLIVDPSQGVLPISDKITLDKTFSGGWFSFSCENGATGRELNYSLIGSSASSYKTKYPTLTVVLESMTQEVLKAPSVNYLETDSTPTNQIFTSFCSISGVLYFHLIGIGYDHPTEETLISDYTLWYSK